MSRTQLLCSFKRARTWNWKLKWHATIAQIYGLITYLICTIKFYNKILFLWILQLIFIFIQNVLEVFECKQCFRLFLLKVNPSLLIVIIDKGDEIPRYREWIGAEGPNVHVYHLQCIFHSCLRLLRDQLLWLLACHEFRASFDFIFCQPLHACHHVFFTHYV
jgi:hypothetical protein